jgi:hypothetical protein
MVWRLDGTRAGLDGGDDDEGGRGRLPRRGVSPEDKMFPETTFLA